MKPTLLVLLTAHFVFGDQAENEFTILHTNDVHSRYDQANVYGTDCTNKHKANNECFGGLARLKTAVDSVRAKNKNTLLFDAGDQFQGTLFYTIYQGDVTWGAMNILGYNVSTLGNHEFDNGPENTGRVVSNYSFPVVSSNIDVSAYPLLHAKVQKYHLFEKERIAVVGYLTKTAPAIAKMKDVKVEDPIQVLQQVVDEVNNLGYTRVIAVSHNGYEEDIKLAQKVSGISLIVGGHSHSYLAPIDLDSHPFASEGDYPTAIENPANKTTYIVQAFQWTHFLGHVDIRFGPDGYLTQIAGAPIELDASVAQDEETDKWVQTKRGPFQAFVSKEIGETTQAMDQSKCQAAECEMGSLICDAILDYARDADFALINAGAVRASLPEGTINFGHVITVLPFGASIVQLQLTGAEIWDIIEGVVTRMNSNGVGVSSFIQVAGIKFSYMADQPRGQSLFQVSVLERATNEYVPIDKASVYVMATNDFVASGGDYILPSPAKNAVALNLVRDEVSRYLSENIPTRAPAVGRIIKVTKIDELVV